MPRLPAARPGNHERHQPSEPAVQSLQQTPVPRNLPLSQGQSVGSRLSPLSSAFLDLGMRDYERIWQFVSDNPGVASQTEISILTNQALVEEKAGNAIRAQTCIHHAILLKKCKELEVKRRAPFFKRMSDKESDTFLEVFATFKTAYANVQMIAKGLNPQGRNRETHLQTRIETYGQGSGWPIVSQPRMETRHKPETDVEDLASQITQMSFKPLQRESETEPERSRRLPESRPTQDPGYCTQSQTKPEQSRHLPESRLTQDPRSRRESETTTEQPRRLPESKLTQDPRQHKGKVKLGLDIRGTAGETEKLDSRYHLFNRSVSSPPEATPKYYIEDEVGHGSTGKVVVVRRYKDGQLFARKTIEITTDNIKNRVNIEWTILKALKHRHIVRYSHREDEERSNGIPLVRIYMEFCQGGDLHFHIQGQKRKIQKSRQLALSGSQKDVLSQGRRSSVGRSEVDKALQGGPEQPEHVIWDTLMQIASALAYCHHNIPYTDGEMILDNSRSNIERVCHRDLTPSNVFLALIPESDELQIKLGDFGLAVDLRGGPARTWTGTGDFTAPEIAMGNNTVDWTVKADIYSLGCVLYYMCTGNAPDALYTQEPAQVANAIGATYPESVGKMIIRCTREDPAVRLNACDVYNTARRCLSKAAKGKMEELSDTVQALAELQASRKLGVQLNQVSEHKQSWVGNQTHVYQGNIHIGNQKF